MDTKKEKTIEEMIRDGEIAPMTECAYGSTIADDERNNTFKPKDNK